MEFASYHERKFKMKWALRTEYRIKTTEMAFLSEAARRVKCMGENKNKTS